MQTPDQRCSWTSLDLGSLVPFGGEESFKRWSASRLLYAGAEATVYIAGHHFVDPNPSTPSTKQPKTLVVAARNQPSKSRLYLRSCLDQAISRNPSGGGAKGCLGADYLQSKGWNLRFSNNPQQGSSGSFHKSWA